MSNLGLNDDGSVSLPRTNGPDGMPRPPIILPEPSMKQLARIHQIASQADDKLPDFDTLPDEPEPADVERQQEQLKQRTVLMFSEDSPHGNAVIEIVQMLTGEVVTEDDLPGWVMGPRTMRLILNHFQAPLLGEGSVPGAPTVPVATPFPQADPA